MLHLTRPMSHRPHEGDNDASQAQSRDGVHAAPLLSEGSCAPVRISYIWETRP